MARRKRKSTKRKKSAFKMAKGGVYAVALAAPAYSGYQALVAAGQTPMEAAIGTAGGFAGLGGIDKRFSTDQLVAYYKPVATVMVLDWVTSKAGLQRRLASAINGIVG